MVSVLQEELHIPRVPKGVCVPGAAEGVQAMHKDFASEVEFLKDLEIYGEG